MKICDILFEEVKEIKNLHYKMLGLKDLLMTLPSTDCEDIDFIEKVKNDYGQICGAYDDWWAAIQIKYTITQYKANHLSVNFSDRGIYLDHVTPSIITN